MNQPRGAATRSPAPPRLLVTLGIVCLICAVSLFANPLASAAVRDSSGSAYDLTSALATSPSTFADPASDVSTFTRDSIETNGLSTCGNYLNAPTNTYSVWYTYTPPAGGGWLTLSTFNAATNYDTVIEVWRGSVAAANSAGCNDDAISGDRRSELTLPVAGTTPYFVAVRRYGSSAMAAPQLEFSARFSGVRELFVDQVAGNDMNPGSPTLALRTIGQAVGRLPLAGGTVTMLSAGVYNEAVTIGVPTTLNVPSGTVTITSATLATSPITLTGTIDADTVTVQPGAKVQEAVGLVKDGGTIDLADGTYAEHVTIGKSLTLQAINEGLADIKPGAGTAIQLAGGAVTLKGLSLQADTGVAISGGAGHVLYHNNIFGNTSSVGVDNQTAIQVDATQNWWGDRTGPPGDGDNALGAVSYRPWCVSALPDCSSLLGQATQLRFSASPDDTRANAVFASQPIVEAVDDEGNLDTSFTGVVALAIKGGSGTAGATLGGTPTMSAVAGIADFTGKGVKIDYVGQDYQLVVSSGAINSTASDDSATFAIGADRLVVTASPANPTAAGAALALTVAAQDGAGHTDATLEDQVSLAIQTNPTSAVLQGTADTFMVAGVATFGAPSDANIQVAGTGYTLRASSGSLAPGDSNAFDISTGAASKLVFSTSPGGSVAGVAFAIQPVVRVEDDFGNLAANFNGPVALSIASGTGAAGATLGGTLSVNAAAGVADFAGRGLNIVKAAAGYQLTAASAGLSSGTSAAFTITADTATQLAFTQSPSSAQAGVAFVTQPVVEARDQYGNTATGFSGTVALAITNSTGTPGAALSGSLSISASGGVASFAGLSIDVVGNAYQLTATSGALTAASGTFNITASGLVFIVQPATTGAGMPLSVKVAARDLAGNTDTSFTGAVTLAIKGGNPRTGPFIYGTATVNAASGVADFNPQLLNIHEAGTGYVLTATSGALPDADSATFDITAGPATKLVVAASPANTPAGAPLLASLNAQDAFGNLDSSFSGTVDLAIQTNPGGGSLGGSVSKAAVAGSVSFTAADGVTINKIGLGYVLRATSGALASGDTAAFNITADRLVWSVSPGTAAIGAIFAAQPVVRAEDSFGTLDTTYAGTVTLAIAPGTGAAGASLLGTRAISAVGGIASFSGLRLDRMGTGYRLDASALGLAGATSAAFDIGKAVIYLPSMIVPVYADLVGSFTISEPSFNSFDPVRIAVTITNNGDAPASDFWVDFYINPLTPPTAANQPWDKSCGMARCKFGLAWYVADTIAPGGSITLYSTAGSYYAKNTDWPGHFETTKLDLYVYVDSWNPGIANGAVIEKSEANNRAEMHLGGQAASAPELAPAPSLPALPNRPQHP